mmetsp:Transcript_13522/g.32611  ORF Transcript_13522/g.32611 Transcript_13522/m.32611 type:complete len:202 (-) Transcript_13522:2972-3577(-)
MHQSSSLSPVIPHLGHFLGLGIFDIALLVIMWCDFYQPFGLDWCHLSHEFLGCEGQLKIQEPWRRLFFFCEYAAGVNENSLMLFHRSIIPSSSQPRNVVKEASSNCFQYSIKIIWLGYIVINLDSFAQSLKLLPNIPGPSNASHLNKVFDAPPIAVVCRRPFRIASKQRNVVAASASCEIQSCRISMDRFIFWAIEYRCSQ